MSIYALNKLLYQLENDAHFREAMKRDPQGGIAAFSLTSDERRALTSGDIRALYQMGVHPFLLNALSRHELFGVDNRNYQPRIRGEG